MAVLTSLRYERTRVRQTKTGQRVRLVATITTQLGGVFNLTHPSGVYSRAYERNGSPYLAWSNYPTPPYEHETVVAGAEGCTEPRFAWDARRRLLLVCNSSGTIMEHSSDDDGYTWNTAVSRFVSASHPDISASCGGLILRAAYAAGALSITRQYPGDSAPGSAFNAKNSAGADLSLTDDSFRLVADTRGWWWLHVRLSASGATSLLYSTDDGATWSVTSGAVSGIASGTHPGLCAAADGALYAYAFVSPNSAQMTRRFPGDTAWSTPVAIDDAAGADLVISDRAFSLAQAFEGPRRLILAGVISGEPIASDWSSASDAESFTRFTV